MLMTANPDTFSPSFGFFRGTSLGLDLWSDSAQTSLVTQTPLERMAQGFGCYVAGPYIDAPNREREVLVLAFPAEVIAGLVSKEVPQIVPATPPLSFQELARLTSMRFSISKTDLAARVFRVSRPTVYNWIAGVEPEDARAQERLKFLGALAQEISRKTPRPLYRRFVYEVMPGEQKSILELLEGETWDQAFLRRLCLKARELTTRRDERLGVHARLSPEEEEANYLDNLLSLGGE